MLDLEKAIQEWRQRMTADGVHSSEVLDELECHLRDDIEAQLRENPDAQAAFEAATERLGAGVTIRNEFRKAGVAVETSRIKTGLCALAGIPCEPAAAGAVGSGALALEQGWVTYARSALFAIPAIVVWAFSVVFLVPKLQAICAQAAVQLPGVFYFVLFCSVNAHLAAFVAILFLMLLEFRTTFWARIRRAFMGLVVISLNAAVLVMTVALLVLALLVAVDTKTASAKAVTPPPVSVPANEAR